MRHRVRSFRDIDEEAAIRFRLAAGNAITSPVPQTPVRGMNGSSRASFARNAIVRRMVVREEQR